jgi:hypothetical protein
MLLCVAALAIVVRIVDSRSVIGFALLGLLIVCASGQAVWHFSGHIDGANVALAADEDSAEADPPAEGPVVSTSSTDESASDEEDTEPGDDEELTIEIRSGKVIIPPRPEQVAKWVESDPVRSGSVHTTAVSSGPQVNRRDCRRALDEELMEAVREYVDEYLGDVYADQVKASSLVNYDLAYIKKHLVRPENIYHEEIQNSFGPMQQMHALLEFDDAFRKDLDERWHALVAMGRVMGTALAFGFVLALLGVVFGYFRIDTATRGYYTGRLQFSAAMVILTLIVAGVFMARQILFW